MSFPAVEELTSRPKLFLKPAAAAQSFRKIVGEWQRRRRSRTELARMTDRALWDLGYTRCDAEAETRKPFWTP
jgi:uncharacterized protein YjiS (DUF1127 family)